MDFNHRITPTQQPTQRPAPAPEMVMPARKEDKKSVWARARSDAFGLWGRIGTNLLLFVVALLIAALAWFIYSDKPATQRGYVDHTKLQAIFLNTGQVYFGNVQALNSSYFVLTNVFYLQSNNSSSTTNSNTSNSNQNLSLVKLGCELHSPYDQMIINSNEVTFWENLQPSGQVAKAVAQFQKDNPSGQKCSNTAAQASSTNLQNSNAGTSNTSTSSSSTSTSK